MLSVMLDHLEDLIDWGRDRPLNLWIPGFETLQTPKSVNIGDYVAKGSKTAVFSEKGVFEQKGVKVIFWSILTI
jgi:hypothetical protein